MNRKTQLDFHPDAESLSAFAEQAVSEKEHSDIAAHLAKCGRCRQVVFLAQQAATAEEDLAAAGAALVVARPKPWFQHWWLVWAPTAAMAMVVALAVYVHVRRAETVQEMAKATQEASPLTAPQNGIAANGATQTQTAPNPPMEEKKRAAASEKPVPPMARAGAGAPNVTGKIVNGGREQALLPPPPVAAPPPEPLAVNEMKPPPAETAQAEQATNAQAAATQMVEQARTSAVQAQGRQPMHSAMLAAAAPRPAVSTAPAPAFAMSPMTTKVFEVSAAKAVTLPSGLPAISTVKGKQLTLALDKAGTLFVSTADEEHWQSVARQWSGLAVTVRMQDKNEKAYELVNDLGQRWMSTDGRLWTAE